MVVQREYVRGCISFRGKECNKLQNQSKKNSCSRGCKVNQSGITFKQDQVPMAWSRLYIVSSYLCALHECTHVHIWFANQTFTMFT